MRQRVTFDGRRAVVPDGGKVFLGVSGDHLVEELAFRTPGVPDATAYLKLRHGRNEYKLELDWDGDGEVWTIAVTRTLLAMHPRIEAQVQLEAPAVGGDAIVWQSLIFPMYVEETIDADGPIAEAQAPYLQKLDLRVQQLDLRVQQNAQLAANATRAQPYVGENGNWFAWDEDAGGMTDTGVSATGPTGATGLTGPAGPAGPAGQSAYEAARAGGYTDTQTAFYADSAAIQGLAAELAAL